MRDSDMRTLPTPRRRPTPPLRPPTVGQLLRAFTLIEILIVVAILGVASAIIVPQIGSHDDLKLRAAARRLMADVMYAQNLAITTQRPHYLVFSGGGYRLQNTPGAADPITHPTTRDPFIVTLGAASPDRDLRALRLEWSAGGVAYPSTAVLRFNSLGVPSVCNLDDTTRADLTTAGQFSLSTSDAGPLTVLVEPSTGETSVAGE